MTQLGEHNCIIHQNNSSNNCTMSTHEYMALRVAIPGGLGLRDLYGGGWVEEREGDGEKEREKGIDR